MDEKKLIKRIAQLESINDQLVAELEFLDNITKELGFQEGIKTLKAAAKELLEEQQNEEFEEEDDHNPPLAG
jgi:hypothetical protein